MRYIAIEGNIGGGKTTLAHQLAAATDASLMLEEFAENSFLPRFYDDPQRYAFPLELSFLADRHQQFRRRTTADLFHSTLISDYSFVKSRLFARINLDEDEYRLFCSLYDIMAADIPQPDLLIYLHAPVPVLMERIRGRGRPFEGGISAGYLQKVEDVYAGWLRESGLPVLYVDSTLHDFQRDETAFGLLKRALEEPLTPGNRFLTNA